MEIEDILGWKMKVFESVFGEIAKAKLIEEIAVYKEKIKHTGFSIGWSGRSGRSYFRFKEVLDHYECVFELEYKDGRTGRVKCKKHGAFYNELIKKPKIK